MYPTGVEMINGLMGGAQEDNLIVAGDKLELVFDASPDIDPQLYLHVEQNFPEFDADLSEIPADIHYRRRPPGREAEDDVQGQDRDAGPLPRLCQRGARRAPQALDSLDLEVLRNEFLCVGGPSGCGKSTLIAAIAGFLKPAAGELRTDGRRIAGPGADRGVVFQEYALLPWKTVIDNVALGLKLKGIGRRERHEMARRYLRLTNLEYVADKYPHELSGGMKQRAAVARTPANEPEIMLMEEPFAAIDAQTRMTLQEELLRIWQRSQVTVLFVTHSVEEAVFLADRVAVLTSGPGPLKTVIPVPIPRSRRKLAAARRRPDLRRDPRPRAGAGADRLRAGGMRGADRLRLLAARPVWATLVLLAAITGWQLWGGFAASQKLAAGGLDDLAGPGHVAVVIDIEPEQFHMFAFQTAGRLVEVAATSAYLMDVPPERLRALAANYWVAEIRPWAGH